MAMCFRISSDQSLERVKRARIGKLPDEITDLR